MESLGGIFWIIFMALVVWAVVKAAKLIGKPLEANVVERWGAFLPGAQTSGNDFLLLVENELDERKLSYKYERMSLDVPPKVKNRIGNSPAVKITYDQLHSCFVGYELTGKDLHLSCAFHRKSPMIYAVPVIGGMLGHTWESVYIHENNRLLAFATEIIECVTQAKDKLVDNLDMEKSAVRVREASGKLGPL